MRPGFAKISVAAALAAACLAAGCTRPAGYDEWVSVSPADIQGDVTLFRDVHFEDIPVPAEYVLQPDESYSFQGARFRTAVFHYEGPVRWPDALAFYRAEMPAQGWTMLDTIERGPDYRLLEFTKGPEKAILVVRQLTNGSRTEIQIADIERNDLLLRGKLPRSH